MTFIKETTIKNGRKHNRFIKAINIERINQELVWYHLVVERKAGLEPVKRLTK